MSLERQPLKTTTPGLTRRSPSSVSQTAREVREASEATGLPVHGLVDMKHWDIRLSSPDPKVRDEGVEILRRASQRYKQRLNLDDNG